MADLDFKPQSMLDFASYLRDTHGVAEEDPAMLAARFGLPVDIVEESLQAVGKAIRKPEVKRKSKFKFSGPWRPVRAFLHDHPIWTAIILGMLIVGSFVLGRYTDSAVPGIVGVSIAVISLVIANFVRAQMRYAIATSFIVTLPAVGLVTFRLAQTSDAAGITPGAIVSNMFSLLLILGIIVSFIVMPAALIGGYRRMRHEANKEEKLDRFEMLQKIFALKSRLVEKASSEQTASRQLWFVKWRKKWLLVAAGLGIGIGLSEAVIRLTIGMPDVGGEAVTPAQSLIALLLLLIVVTSSLVTGLIAGSWSKGIASGAIYTAVSIVTLGLILPNGFAIVMEPYQESPYALGVLLLNPMLGMVGGLGGAIETSAERKRRIATTDRAAVLSEIVRLQQALKTGAQDVCLMVVDAVGSTKMKLGADSYDIEASFGALQNYIARKVAEFEGSVYSVAGDGAITKFDDAQSAYDCAFSVLADLNNFNDKFNRLGSPFELRIGIHSGHVPGDLDKVAFSRVIDVAAHMEKVAPVGGIASSGKAFLAIEGATLRKLDDKLDGEDVYVLEPEDAIES